ncbi:hypothetical protein X739_32970 [Mesorhizobium sp. LNHC220B00]|nr:DUF262 domain-containing protein [Mesorhizobium sp. LNHC220B00]ESY77454.1 hypothetical protein X739_32970 [Mesorhizobium sp. LNHC220B00]
MGDEPAKNIALRGAKMNKRISAAEYPLSKIFGSDFEFHIPSYQRPYAWNADQATELFDDLLAFHRAEADEGYFLGSIVLIKKEGEPQSEVIDGQQRLTTLTMLLATIASRLEGSSQKELMDHIVEPGQALKGIKARPRLSLRERDSNFFRQYVQNLQLNALQGLDPASLENESRVNIRANCGYFLDALSKEFPEDDSDDLAGFATFILTRCYLVAVSTPSQASAFRVFSVMNSRGLDLQPTDIIKADIIGKLKSEKERQAYNDKWEEMEVELTRVGFNDLFGFIRMIYGKEKAKRSLLEEFRTQVLPSNKDPKLFIDDVLEPFTDALQVVRRASYMSTAHAETVNGYIRWLHRIDNSDWIPPAILFLKDYKHKPKLVASFFEKLERLAAWMHICRINVNQRIEIYANLIEEIEAGEAPDAMEWLDLNDEEKKDFLGALDDNVYYLTPRRRNYLILRLDSFISDGAASYDPSILTIEHVLPRTVGKGSQWEKWWPDESVRHKWVHRLANLVPLNKKKNSSAQNFDFAEKCDIYFKGTKNISSYALTSQVLSSRQWNEKSMKLRQEKLLSILSDGWDLHLG